MNGTPEFSFNVIQEAFDERGTMVGGFHDHVLENNMGVSKNMGKPPKSSICS